MGRDLKCIEFGTWPATFFAQYLLIVHLFQWFNQEAHPVPLEALKYQADHAYATRNFSKANQLFRQVLAGNTSKGSPLYREATESLVRCCLRTKKYEEGKDLALQLLKLSNPANQEHLSNTLLLLSEVYLKSGEFKRTAGCIIALLGLHPHFPKLWLQLSETFEALGDSSTSKSCLERANHHAQSFRHTIPDGFVKGAYEFEDLGSSKVRAQKEKEVEKRSNAKTEHPPPWLSNDSELDDFIQRFVGRHFSQA